MAAIMVQSFAGLSVSGLSHACSCKAQLPTANFSFSGCLRGQPLLSVSRQVRSSVAVRGMFQPVEAKQNSLKRERTAEKSRLYNKARKSAIATRMKKVFSAVNTLRSEMPSSEDAIKPLEKLMSEAYSEIDKAIVKGILHKNTGARRKARLAAAKRQLLVDAGLYTPAQPEASTA